jgi:hypothetical protein
MQYCNVIAVERLKLIPQGHSDKITSDLSGHSQLSPQSLSQSPSQSISQPSPSPTIRATSGSSFQSSSLLSVSTNISSLKDTENEAITQRRPYFLLNNRDSLLESSSEQQAFAKITNLKDATSTLHLAWSFANSDHQSSLVIRGYINKIIHQFSLNPIDLGTIQELVVLTETKDKDIFIRVLDQLLKVQRDSIILSVLVIHGIAVVLGSATEEIDLSGRFGLFYDSLRPLKERLDNISTKNNHEELLALLRALSVLFKAMICRGIEGIDRKDIFNPMKSRLDELSDNVDPEISFLASYASQSLVYIGNDESKKMSILRRGKLVIGIAVDVKDIVTSFDITKFEDVYNKIMDMKDFSFQLGWYQALMFADTLLMEQSFGDFEIFITYNKYNCDTKFMQGACLQLEQLASTYKYQEISIQAVKLLNDIELHNTGIIQETAKISIKRLQGT